MPLGSSSATPVIRPGPSLASVCSFMRSQKVRTAVTGCGSSTLSCMISASVQKRAAYLQVSLQTVARCDNSVEISDVVKTFRSVTAVDHLSLAVPEGSVYGFIGPNGSGKSTTMRMIASILYPDSGSIRVFGEE